MSGAVVVERSQNPLTAVRTLRTIVRNPMDAWPDAVYAERLVQTHFLGRRNFFVCAPELVKQVTVDDADRFIKAEDMRRALEPALGQGILTAEHARWRFQRRVSAPVFRPAHVNSFVPAMLSAARGTRARWAALPDSARLEVDREMMRLTFDIILETMLSGRGGIDVSRVEESIRNFLESTSWAVALYAMHAPAWVPYPGKLRAVRGQTHLRDMTRARVRERRASGERRADLMSLMLDARDPETGEGMEERDIVDNLLTFIGAGHETTALALTYTFYLLAKHPEIEARVLDEIASVTGGAEVEPEHLDQLVYTKQVINEAMRVYPPVPMIVRAATAPVSLDGVEVRAGENILIPIYAIHHNASLWPEPARFDPERFAPDAVRARHRYAYLPFGAGPRICIGMGFALVEAVAILATLLPAVRLAALPGFKPAPKLRVTMRPAEGMPMVVGRR